MANQVDAASLFKTEIAVYKKHLPGWEDQEGKVALIFGEEVTVWDTNEEAIEAGCVFYELGSFMVREIHQIEKPIVITRLLFPESNIRMSQ